MRIYRFVPNAREFSYTPRSLAGKWWPDGIDLGEVPSRLFPKYLGEVPYPWPHDGNQFSRDSDFRDFSDFPALSLNVPVMSERAVSALTSANIVLEPIVPMHVEGLRFFAIQPKRSPGVLRASASAGLIMPYGEVFFYYQRYFDVSAVNCEFFMLDELMPFSDLYVTERFVDAAKAAGLTGLEYLELVFDESGPVVPTYPAVERDKVSQFSVRLQLELDMISWRCAVWGYGESEAEDVTYAAISRGLIADDFVPPVYVRERE